MKIYSVIRHDSRIHHYFKGVLFTSLPHKTSLASAKCLRLMMSTTQNEAGIVKKSLTGNQRRKLRSAQAAMMGISGNELLFRRRTKMEEWHKEKKSLISSRCPNCGVIGHSFKFCPFASFVHSRLENGTHFRGPNGSWSCSEPALELSLEERQRFEQHFKFLSTPIGAKSKNANLQFAQKGATYRSSPTLQSEISQLQQQFTTQIWHTRNTSDFVDFWVSRKF